MKIADGVFFYKGRSSKNIGRGAGSPNVTIVKGDSLAFIDTGVKVGGAFCDLIPQINSDSLDISSNISWILFTHCHWDHINAADKLIDNCKMPFIGAGVMDIPYIEDKDKYMNEFISGHFSPFEKEIFPYPRFLTKFILWFIFGPQPNLIVNKSLKDGDIIDIGKKIEVISLPGHTAGHVGYFIKDAGVLVTGDLFDFENSLGMDINNHYSNYEDAMKSLERVRIIDPEVIIPGHGDIALSKKESRKIIERSLASGLSYIDKIQSALKKSKATLTKLCKKAFPDTSFQMSSMIMMLTLCVLMHLEKKGSVKRISYDKGSNIEFELLI